MIGGGDHHDALAREDPVQLLVQRRDDARVPAFVAAAGLARADGLDLVDEEDARPAIYGRRAD